MTFDAFGTLVELRDPVATLCSALAAAGVERGDDAVRAAFEAEAAHYKAHRLDARDEATIARLHRDCTAVFLDAVGAELPSFDYLGAFRYDVLPGVEPALARLARCGLELAVVANWDASLHERLRELALDGYFSAVVTAPEVGAEKPDPAVFRAVLDRVGVPPDRALHIGDQPADEEGARAAGLRFAWAPVPGALEAWT